VAPFIGAEVVFARCRQTELVGGCDGHTWVCILSFAPGKINTISRSGNFGRELVYYKTRCSCVLGALAILLAWQPVPAASTISPSLFARGIISGPADDLSPAFSPDGKAVYFTRSNNSASTIMVSTLAGDHWSQPEIAPFSGQWSDFEPTMAPDGSFLIFASNRATDGSSKAIDGTFNGKTFVAGGGNLWRVDRRGNEWLAPKRLPNEINEGTAVFSPSITADGSLYFMRPDSRTGIFRLLRAQYRSGRYLPSEPVVLGDADTEEVDPAIAPDESFLVYSANHPGKGPKRLMIAFHQGHGWTTPQDLGDEVNEAGSNIEARLGADHRTLYFSTNTVPPVTFPRTNERARRDLADMLEWANGRQNIWFVSLAPWLDHH
jgi:WD40-like Beta Propeller Repeat